MAGWSTSAGFSLFELVVFIISVAILYAYAANRFAEFPGQAERANFLAITTQLQTAVNLEVNLARGLGRLSRPEMLAGANPMDLLLQPPSNYLGAFESIDTSSVGRRLWYFDRSRQELVYLVNDSTGVFYLLDGEEFPTAELRFRIVAEYEDFDAQTRLPVSVLENAGNEVSEENRETRLSGVLMRPVIPYRWGAVAPRALIDEAL